MYNDDYNKAMRGISNSSSMYIKQAAKINKFHLAPNITETYTWIWYHYIEEQFLSSKTSAARVTTRI